MSTINHLVDNAEAFLAEDFSTKNIVKNNARVALVDQVVTRRCILELKAESQVLLTVPVVRVTFNTKVTRTGSRGVLISKNQDAYILKFFRKGIESLTELNPSDKIWAYIYSKNLIQICWEEICGKFDNENVVLGTVKVPSSYTGMVRVKPQEVGGKLDPATTYAKCHNLEFGVDSCLWVDDDFLCSWNPLVNTFDKKEIVNENGIGNSDGVCGNLGNRKQDMSGMLKMESPQNDGDGGLALPSFSEFVSCLK